MLLRLRNRFWDHANEPHGETAIDAELRAHARSFAAPLVALAALVVLFLSFAAATAAEPTTVPSAVAPSASAEQGDRRLGDHPAVIIQRLHARQGFDYAGTFYPHPAWLFLSSEAPRPMMDHPAVIVFRRYQDEEAARAAAPSLQAQRDAAAS